MKLYKKPSLLKLTILITVSLLAAGTLYYLFTNQKSDQIPNYDPAPVNTINYDPPTEQEIKDASSQKDEIVKDPPANAPNATLEINIVRANGNPFNIRTYVTGTKSGTCTATLKKTNQKTVTKTFNIKFEATSASCNGNIDLNEFSTGGEWDLSMVASSGSNKSPTITQKVEVEK